MFQGHAVREGWKRKETNRECYCMVASILHE